MQLVQGFAALALVAGTMVAVDASPSGAAVVAPVWSVSGSIGGKVVSSGKTSVPAMSYSLKGNAVYTDQTWDFHATALISGTVTLPYDWSGLHQYNGVVTHLAAYVNHAGVVTTTPLVAQGPVNCCTAPSAGFHYTGSLRLQVAQGDVYGFRLGGSNTDAVKLLTGKFTVGPPTAITARALVKAGTAGLGLAVAVKVVALTPWSGVPNGLVTVSEGTTNLGGAYLSGGEATVIVTVANTGPHRLTVKYAGNSSYATSTTAATTTHGYDIAAGYAQSLVLKSDSTVAAFGCSSAGECSVPAGLNGVTAIAAGFAHSLALKSDSTVVALGCIGYDFGQCSVPAGLSGVTAVAAGAFHSLALKSDGTVVAFGCGLFGDAGQCAVPAGLSGVTAIAAGKSHSLALKSDGTVVAFGCLFGSDYGQCAVPAGLSGVTAIAAGYTHSLALKSDGTVVAFGCGLFGDWGQCTVPAGLSGVTAIAASGYTGGFHSLALKSDGTVVAFGCFGAGNDVGQCTVPAGLSGVTAIAAGANHSLALKSDGTVVAFGCGGLFGDYGQCDVTGI